jgi:tetratricopeptide (TPR) repeat protein
MRALFDGRLDDVEPLAVRARDLGSVARSQDSARNFAGQLATLRREQGRSGEIVELLRGARAQFARISIWRAGFVNALADGGKRDEARAELDAWLREGLPDPLADSNGVVSLVLLGEVCSDVNARDAANEIQKRLERYAGENAAPAFGAVCVGSVDHALGLIASTLGRPDEALTRLRSAERASERQGARPTLARARLGIARALRQRGEAGDEAAAREIAASSAALAESLGMSLVAARARNPGS